MSSHVVEVSHKGIVILSISVNRTETLGVIPVRMWAKAYLRVILSAGCLGPNTSRRNAVRLHRMPRKQKAAMTLSNKIVWGFTQ